MDIAIERLVRSALVALATTAILGTIAGLAGGFSAVPIGVAAVILGLFDAVRSQAVNRPPASSAQLHRWESACIAVTLGVVALAVAVNWAYHSELVFTGRDGATYANTAMSLHRNSTLRPEAIPVPFQRDDVLSVDADGFTASGGRINHQFLHAYPAMLATFAGVLGETWIWSATPVLGGLALLAFGVAIRRWTGSWWSLVGTIALASSLPFLYFSRSTFTEIPTMAFVLGGVATAGRGLDRNSRSDLRLAGVLLGCAALLRVDGWLVLAAVAWTPFVASTFRGRRAIDEGLADIWWPALAVAVLGILDLVIASPEYLGVVRPQLMALIGLTVVGRIVSAGDGLRSLLPHHGRFVAILPWILAGFWITVGVIRPLWLPSSGATYGLDDIELMEGLVPGTGRDYAELTLWWLTWYGGVPLVALATAGTVRAAALLRHRSVDTFATLAVLICAGPTLLYLLDPHANPDHPWVMRRYLPVVIPAGIFASISTAKALTERAGRRSLRTVAAAGLTGLILVPPFLTSLPLLTQREFGGALAGMAELCERIDGRPTIVANEGDSRALTTFYLHPVRNWCGVSAVSTTVDRLAHVKVDGDVAVLSSGARPEVEFDVSVIDERLLGPPVRTRQVHVALGVESLGRDWEDARSTSMVPTPPITTLRVTTAPNQRP